MSLWTPDGEHRVEREDPSVEDDVSADFVSGDDPLAGMSPEEREQAMAMAQEMDEVRRQLASVPAAVVIANHAMGLYELAAIPLSSDAPRPRWAPPRRPPPPCRGRRRGSPGRRAPASRSPRGWRGSKDGPGRTSR